jgi:hypothetical protein
MINEEKNKIKINLKSNLIDINMSYGLNIKKLRNKKIYLLYFHLFSIAHFERNCSHKA